MKKKIILFGLGAKCLSSLSYLTNEYDIVAIIDNDAEKQGLSIKGIPVGGVTLFRNLIMTRYLLCLHCLNLK